MDILTAFKKGSYLFGVKLFHHIPINIKNPFHEIKLSDML
jgi:hypothetical protein